MNTVLQSLSDGVKGVISGFDRIDAPFESFLSYSISPSLRCASTSDGFNVVYFLKNSKDSSLYKYWLQEEVEAYERLCQGELNELYNVRSIGHLLISARIARGLSQRELAERLGVNESSISRDEGNEYHNITLDRAARILETLGVAFHATPELIPEAELAAH